MEIKMNNDGKMEVDFSGVPDYVMDAFNSLMKKIGEWNQSQQELESSDNQQKDNKRWKPNDREMYFYIGGNGVIFTDTWSESDGYLDRTDADRYFFNNVFNTNEEAEFEVERRKVMVELEDYAREHNDKMDWNNDCQTKYYIGFINNEEKEIYIGQALLCKIFGVIYFSSEEITQKAIRAVGEDRIKKYCFGIDINKDEK